MNDADELRDMSSRELGVVLCEQTAEQLLATIDGYADKSQFDAWDEQAVEELRLKVSDE